MNPIISPESRLWKSIVPNKQGENREGDRIKEIVFVTGSMIYTFLNAVQTLLDKLSFNSPFNTLLDLPFPMTSFLLSELTNNPINLECTSSHPILTSIATLAKRMMLPVASLRPSLQQVKLLLNYFMPEEWRFQSDEIQTICIMREWGKNDEYDEYDEHDKSSIKPFLARKEQHPLDSPEEWDLLVSNQIESYLLQIIPHLLPSPNQSIDNSQYYYSNNNNNRLNHLTGMASEVLQYDKYVSEKLEEERSIEITAIPLLQMNMEDIMKISMTLSEVQELMGVLEAVREREKERSQALLSIECVTVLAVQFLRILSSKKTDDYILQVFGLVTALERHPIILPYLWTVYSDQFLSLFTTYSNTDILSTLAHLLFNHLSIKQTHPLLQLFLPPTTRVHLLLASPSLLQDVVHHPSCSLHSLAELVDLFHQHGHDLTEFTPFLVNHIQSLHMKSQLSGHFDLREFVLILRLLLMVKLNGSSPTLTTAIDSIVMELVEKAILVDNPMTMVVDMLVLVHKYFHFHLHLHFHREQDGVDQQVQTHRSVGVQE